jgi:hypothetical protein
MQHRIKSVNVHDVAARVGTMVVKSRESDGRTQPVPVEFRLGDVELRRAVEKL